MYMYVGLEDLDLTWRPGRRHVTFLRKVRNRVEDSQCKGGSRFNSAQLNSFWLQYNSIIKTLGRWRKQCCFSSGPGGSTQKK
jgi:hypothetical protein